MKYHFILGFLLLFFSCKKKGATDPGSGYDPNKPSFRVGTKWVYVLKAYDQNGIQVNENTDEDIILRDTTINSARYFITKNGTHFSNKPDGHYFFDKNLNQEILYFKYPANVNSAHEIRYNSPFSMPLIAVSVLNTDTTYSSNANTYNKSISYLFNYSIIGGCQGFPSTGRYIFSTKIGLFVYNRFGRNNTTEYSTIEMKSFTY